MRKGKAANLTRIAFTCNNCSRTFTEPGMCEDCKIDLIATPQ